MKVEIKLICSSSGDEKREDNKKEWIEENKKQEGKDKRMRGFLGLLRDEAC